MAMRRKTEIFCDDDDDDDDDDEDDYHTDGHQ